MKLQTTIFSLFILLLMYGCSGNPDTTVSSAPLEAAAQVPQQQENIEVERKLIKEGRVEFETDNIPVTRKLILGSVAKYKGYISSDEERRFTGSISNTLVIRVPANNFDQLLEDATKGVSRFDRKNIEIKDVTEEFLDVQARLKTKKELENKYLEILKKANKVSEILEVEKQIGELRSEIESVEGRMKYLESQVAFSTLTITYYETVPDNIAFGNKFKNGFREGWDNLIWFFVFLTNIWPFVLIGIGVVFLFRRWRRRKRIKQKD